MQGESGKAVMPLRAGWLTRIIYSVALVGFLPAGLAASSGWISLALGGGFLMVLGPVVFLAISALAAFRAYQVLRYRAALDARPPNALGWLLRGLGWLAMLAGAVSTAGLFAVKPVTLLLFKGGGEAGIGYFVVGVVFVALANLGWLGCIVFEVSRPCGPALPEGASPPWSRRKQDFAVLAVLLAAAIAFPYVQRATAVQPCGEKNLAACVSTTESTIRRVVGLPHGEPVVLESTADEIELRGTGGRKWSLLETPQNSLRAAGHPASESAPSAVVVRVSAKEEGKTAVLELAIAQGAEETARFVTRFPRGATVEKTAEGRVRIVVDLPSNAAPGMRSVTLDPRTGKQLSLDQLFIQIRSGLGSELEAREWPSRIQRAATLVSAPSSHPPAFDAEADAAPDPACKGRVELASAQAPAFQGQLGLPMRAVTFPEAVSPGPHALMGLVDRVVCRASEFWIVGYPDRRPEVRIRRYGADGKLARFVDTAIPPADLGALEFDLIDSKSVREENGRLRFERVISSFQGGKQVEKRRELFEVAL